MSASPRKRPARSDAPGENDDQTVRGALLQRAVPDPRTPLCGSVAVTLSARMRSVCPSCCRGDRRSTMDLDPVLLSRLQFAWVIGWHILLPAFTVGMASYIAILEGMHLVTGRSVYL